MATALKEAMEDRRLRLPQGRADLRADLHSVQRVAGPTGAPRLKADREGGSHADRFWALALAASAAAGERPVYAYESLSRQTFARRMDEGDRYREWAAW